MRKLKKSSIHRCELTVQPSVSLEHICNNDISRVCTTAEFRNVFAPMMSIEGAPQLRLEKLMLHKCRLCVYHGAHALEISATPM